jgi:hypothetical protein
VPDDTIAARLVLDGQRQFSSGAQQASKDVKGIGTAAKETETKSKSSLGATSKNLLGAAAAAGVTVKATSALKSSVNTTVDLAKSTSALKRATGLDAKQAQSWAVVTKQRGIETASLQRGMVSLNRALSSSQDPTKGAGAELAKYGLNAKELMALPMDQRMGKIADAFKAMPDGMQKAALAQKLFGRSGAQMLPLLNSGSKGLQGQLDMANKLVPGLGAAGDASLKLAAQQRQMQMASMGLKVAVGSALLPIMLAVSKTITPLVTKFAALMGQSKILTYVVLALGAALVGLFVMSKIAAMTTALTSAEIAHKVASLASAAASKALAAAQWLLNAAMSANPIVLVVIALAALVAGFIVAYNKVTWFHNAVDAMANAAVAAFNWLLGGAQTVFNWIKGNWPLLLGILGGPFGAAAALIITHFDKIKGVATGAFNAIKSAAQTVGSVVSNSIVGAFNAVKSAIQGAIDTVNNLISSVKSIPTDIINKAKGGGVPFVPFVQHGAVNFPGGPAVVGEAGPELVYLPRGANVIPNSLIGGNMAATINVPVYLDKRQIALATGEFYSDQAARQGKAV